MIKKGLALIILALGLTLGIYRLNLYHQRIKVTSVLDGDTFIAEGKGRVRILGLDAPELNRCYGKKSKKRLQELILNKRVRLEILRKDMYKRYLASVWRGNNLVAETLLKEGLARPDYTDIKYNERLKAAYKYAKANKIGLYSGACVSKTPPNPHCIIKGNIDTGTNNKFYHYPGCRHYKYIKIDLDRGERWFCTRAEAEAAGFVKASRCP